jgi:hypothetical protein
MALISAMRKQPQKFQSWSASRLDDYEKCPFFAKLKHLDKLCTICFKGKLVTPRGMPFGTPQVCTACHKTPEKGPALMRGGAIGDRLDLYLTGQEAEPGETIAHPDVLKIVKKAKAAVKRGAGRVQVNARFTREWEVIPGDDFDPGAWLYVKLDYLYKITKKAHVTDWKTGGVDKKTGAVKAQDKYDDQILAYQAATLLLFPDVLAATADLVFLDTGLGHDPVVEREPLKRADLPAALKKLERKSLPIMSDTSFAKKPNGLCGYCDYGKNKSGPCQF